MEEHSFQPTFKHYITINEQNLVTGYWSSAIFPDKDTSNAICVSENTPHYQFRIPETGEVNPNCIDNRTGVYMLKYKDGKIVPRTTEEMQAEVDARPPESEYISETERLRADVDYLSILVEGGIYQ